MIIKIIKRNLYLYKKNIYNPYNKKHNFLKKKKKTKAIEMFRNAIKEETQTDKHCYFKN